MTDILAGGDVAPVAPHVLIVTASASRRGAEIQASQLTAELRRRDVPVAIVALSAGPRAMTLPIPVLGRRRLAPAGLLALRRAAGGVDVVVAYGSSTLPACAIALAAHPTPFVYRSISQPERWSRGRIHRWVTGIQFRRAAKVVALWADAASSIERLYGVPRTRLAVISNARDPQSFRPPTPAQRQAARARLGLDGRRAFAFIGSLAPEKRIELAIAAVALADDIVLVVVGDGPERHRAEVASEREAPGMVCFLGEVDDVVPVLHAVDGLLITSHTEGMPGAAIEAAMCGVPVVATDAGALAEMPGVHLVDDDPALLARALHARDVPEAAMLDAFGWPAVADRWVELLTAVAGDRAVRRPDRGPRGRLVHRRSARR